MARGTANINNLMKTALTARDKQLAYNDQAAAYQWNMSAKTADDLAQYQAYLKKAAGETQDPSKQLTAQTKLVDANRTYTSSEIGRQTIAVLRGEGNNQQKLGVIARLQDAAAANGDASLVQQLDDSYSRLTKTIQDENAAAASKASAATDKGLTDQLNTWKQGQALLKNAFEQNKPLTGPDGQPVKVQYKNGQPVLDKNGMPVQDPNGQPFTLDSRTFAALHGVLLKQQENVMNHQIAQGDPTGSKQLALDNLHTSGEWNMYASPEAFARNQSNSNPFVTKIDDRGKRTLALSDTAAQTQVDPQTGQFKTVMAPKEGDQGNTYILSQVAGGSPNGPTDRYEVNKKPVQLGQDKGKLPDAAGTVPGQPLLGGYGQQNVIANPKAGTILPNGKPATDVLFTAPDKATRPSVAPLKVIGTGPDGKPVYGTSTAADFGGSPGVVAGDPTHIVDDFKNTYVGAGSAASRFLKGVGNFLTGRPQGAQTSIMGRVDHGVQLQTQKRLDDAATALNNQKAAQAAAITQANQAFSAQQAQRAAVYAAQQKAAPTVLRINPTNPQTGNPAQNYNIVTGGNQSQSGIAAGIAAAVQPWWMK